MMIILNDVDNVGADYMVKMMIMMTLMVMMMMMIMIMNYDDDVL